MYSEGCYNLRVSQLINKVNSATMVLLKGNLTRWLYFLSQKLSKGHTTGTGGNQLEQRLWQLWNPEVFPAERDQRVASSPLNEMGWWDLSHSNEDRWEVTTLTTGWRQCPAGRGIPVWNSFTADLRAACSLSSLPQGKNSLWHWLEKRLQIAGGVHLTLLHVTSNYTLKFYSHVSERGCYTGWRHKAHQFSFQHIRVTPGVHEKRFFSVLGETQKHICWKTLFCRSSSAVNQDCRSLGPWKPAHMREHYHKMLLLLHPSHHLLQETSTMEGHINLMKIWKNDQGRNSHGIGSIT